jgi:hypothetical protein
VSDYINLFVRIAHIICNHSLKLCRYREALQIFKLNNLKQTREGQQKRRDACSFRSPFRPHFVLNFQCVKVCCSAGQVVPSAPPGTRD